MGRLSSIRPISPFIPRGPTSLPRAHPHYDSLGGPAGHHRHARCVTRWRVGRPVSGYAVWLPLTVPLPRGSHRHPGSPLKSHRRNEAPLQSRTFRDLLHGRLSAHIGSHAVPPRTRSSPVSSLTLGPSWRHTEKSAPSERESAAAVYCCQ
jgi:hypothetical protein